MLISLAQAMQKLETAEAELSRLRGDLQAGPGPGGPSLSGFLSSLVA